MKFTTAANRVIPSVIFMILVIVLASGCAGNRPELDSNPEFDGSAPPDTVADLGNFGTRIYRDGRVYIGGQPDEDALRALPARGITAVINLRTAKEMEDTTGVPFDEAALVDSLGLEYVWIPLGDRDHPYSPAVVDTFAIALERHPGPVLLHCRSGSRVSYLWAAYLVRHRGWNVSEAYARGEAIGISRSRFARLLDRDLMVIEGTP